MSFKRDLNKIGLTDQERREQEYNSSLLTALSALESKSAQASTGIAAWGTIIGSLSSQTDLQSALDAKAPLDAPTFTTSITGAYLTASTLLITDGSSNIISASTVTYPSLTELSYIKGLTSAIQTQLNSKEGTITTLAISKGGTNSGTALSNNRIIQSSGGAIVEAAAITASRALKSDANGIPVHFDTASEPSLTELSYVKGVTSAVQTQINNKQDTITVLDLSKGGTNKSLTAAAGGIVYTDADSMEILAAGTDGMSLRSNGASPPSWEYRLATQLDILADASVYTYSNAPNSEQNVMNSATRGVMYYDATNAVQIRVTTAISTTSASANSPRIYPSYSTDGGTNWITIGAGTTASGDAISLATGSIKVSNWITVPVGAKGDYLFRVSINGGDSTADPAFFNISIQFR